MESVRIYVPEGRAPEPAVKEALGQVIAGGATLYHATGVWPGDSGLLSERIVVVEVLDFDQGRQQAIDVLVAALLATGEEAVLVATQHIATHLSTTGDGSVQPEPLSLIRQFSTGAAGTGSEFQRIYNY